MIRIAPSILSADFAALADDVARVEAAGADQLHVDVMDGRFVPNLTIGPVVVQALRKRTRLPLDVHLMIVEPERYLADFVAAGADMLTVHAEACVHLQRALAQLSDGVWRMLHAKRAHGQTLSSLQRADVALQGMIEAMLALTEKHDPYTAGSSRRVAALAVALAREAGLDGERQHALRVAALLHDVGNVAVPPSILAKPGALNSAEMTLMRAHVEEGCKLLANIDFGAPVAEIVFEHHERFDGSGYPRGLKGEEILLEARILAIADVVEAMSSPRPYRAALGLDAAIEEINRGAGVTYDLHLATACTRLVRQHGFKFPE